MEQKTIITNGEPNLENLSKEEERNWIDTIFLYFMFFVVIISFVDSLTDIE